MTLSSSTTITNDEKEAVEESLHHHRTKRTKRMYNNNDNGEEEQEYDGDDNSTTMSHHNDDDDDTDFVVPPLPSPTIALTGHTGSIYSLKYSPNGSILCSTSFDKTCLLWDEQYHNYNVLVGHKNAILDCTYCDNDTIITVSADSNVMLWDINTGSRLRKYHNNNNSSNTMTTTTNYQQHQQRYHSSSLTSTSTINAINCCATTPLSNNSSSTNSTTNIFVTGSDDGICRLYDRREKYCVQQYVTNYPILAVAMLESQQTNAIPQIFISGIDSTIICYDMRYVTSNNSSNNTNTGNQKKLYGMRGHTEPITSLAIQPNEHNSLLSNSMDQTMKLWNIQPYVASPTTTTTDSSSTTMGGSGSGSGGKNRLLKTFRGHSHNHERGLLKCSWSYDGILVSCGSADRNVHIWDVYSTEEIYCLPGHKGCVNTVTFRPTSTSNSSTRNNNNKNWVIASGSSDKTIYVGELS